MDAENAPKSSELVRETIRTGACARHSFCGASKCQFNRVETAYGLVQGKFAGIGKLGGGYGGARALRYLGASVPGELTQGFTIRSRRPRYASIEARRRSR